MIEPVAWALSFDGKLQTDLIYTDKKTAVRHAEIENDRWKSDKWSVVEFCPPIPPGFAIVPVEPTEAQWSGLARDIMFVLRQERPTPKKLFYHLTQLGHTLPNWMADETELRDPASDHVISKGTCCVLIYKAMLTAAKGE